MTLRSPEREISSQPRCDKTVQGDGLMSYHCTLPQGHEDRSPDPEDPEPCYAVESSRSTRLWSAWRIRMEQRDAAVKEYAHPESVVIGCPACGEVALKVVWADRKGTCERCGEEVPFQQPASEDPTLVGSDPEAINEILSDVPEGFEPSRTRPGDQPLPDGDESLPDDQSLLIADIEARRHLGISRYGQGHRPFNGRHTLKDLYEEQLDKLVYLRSIVRMSEATRETLVSTVEQALAKAERDYPRWFETADHSDFAGVAVDRIMGWVDAQIIGTKQPDSGRADDDAAR